MGTFAIGGQTLSFERIAKSDGFVEYSLRLEYERPDDGSTRTSWVSLDVESRQSTTQEAVEHAIRDWYEDKPDVTIRSYEVVERIECRRGAPCDGEDEESAHSGSENGGDPAPGVRPREISTGDRVAYYVQGPQSSVYGHVAEGIVEKAPPWEHGPAGQRETVRDSAVLDVGDRTKDVPLAWIVGTTNDEDVGTVIDDPLEST